MRPMKAAEEAAGGEDLPATEPVSRRPGGDEAHHGGAAVNGPGAAGEVTWRG